MQTVIIYDILLYRKFWPVDGHYLSWTADCSHKGYRHETCVSMDLDSAVNVFAHPETVIDVVGTIATKVVEDWNDKNSNLTVS